MATFYSRRNALTRKVAVIVGGHRAPNFIRVRIIKPKGRKLRVIIYVRISTDEQRQSSLKDQEDYCRSLLDQLGLREPDVEILVLQDDGISGEIISRPGVNEAERLACERPGSIVIAEEAARLFRNEEACFGFVHRLLDRECRVICINDFVDTAEETAVWRPRLKDALREAEGSNHKLRCRLMRTIIGLWDKGAAVGALKPGYQRVKCDPRTGQADNEASYDIIDERWASVIREMFERIAAGQSLLVVAKFLIDSGLPRFGQAMKPYDAKGVLTRIRDEIYCGVETYRETHGKKRYSTGKMIQQRTPVENVLRREMPHLAIVSKHLWNQANAAIDARISTHNHSRGIDNPNFNVPRDSRHPLANVHVCHRCGRKMHIMGSCGFHCSGATEDVPEDQRCWNRATAKCAIAYAAIAAALEKHLNAIQSSLPEALRELSELLQDRRNDDRRRVELQTEITNTTAALNRLVSLAEAAEEEETEPPLVLLHRLNECEERLYRAKAELEDLDLQKTGLALQSAEELCDAMLGIAARLKKGDRNVRDDLQQIVPQIRAVPHQQFGCGLVVLRARFQLDLTGLLPAGARLALQRSGEDRTTQLPECFRPVMLEAELFKSSTGPMYGVEAFRLSETLGPTAIGKVLGISKRKACIATEYGKAMKEAGLTDPYVELTEAPANASRWRPEGRKGGR